LAVNATLLAPRTNPRAPCAFLVAKYVFLATSYQPLSET
jgi:hypothetical protein